MAFGRVTVALVPVARLPSANGMFGSTPVKVEIVAPPVPALKPACASVKLESPDCTKR